jgi:hypothetical protein
MRWGEMRLPAPHPLADRIVHVKDGALVGDSTNLRPEIRKIHDQITGLP